MKKLVSIILALSVASTMLAATVISNSAAEVSAATETTASETVAADAVTAETVAAETVAAETVSESKDAEPEPATEAEEVGANAYTQEEAVGEPVDPSKYTDVELGGSFEVEDDDYKCRLTIDRDMVVKVTAEYYWLSASMLDADGNEIKYIGVSHTSDPYTAEYDFELKAGVYYLTCENESGDYTVTVEEFEDYADYQIGETITSSSWRPTVRRFVPSRDMMVQISTENADELKITSGDSVPDSLFGYVYFFSAGVTYYLELEDWNYEGFSLSSREITDCTDLTLGEEQTFTLDSETESKYFRFVPESDMVIQMVGVNCNTYLDCFEGTPRSIARYNSIYFLTAGKTYYFEATKKLSVETTEFGFMIKSPERIGVGETKSLSFDSNENYKHAQIFVPERDMPVRYRQTPDHYDHKVAVTDCNDCYDQDGNIKRVIEITGAKEKSFKALAGHIYLLEDYLYRDFTIEAVLEELLPNTVSLNETIEVNPEEGKPLYYKYVPDSDMRIVLDSTGSGSPVLCDEDLHTLSRFNKYSSANYYSVKQGNTYYVRAPRSSYDQNGYSFTLSKLDPIALTLNSTFTSRRNDCGIRVYSYKPEKDIMVSFRLPLTSNRVDYKFNVYDESDSELAGYSSPIAVPDFDKLNVTQTGTVYYYLLKQGQEYLFDLYIYAGATEYNEVDIEFTEVEPDELELDSYIELNTHEPCECLFFRYTPDQTIMADIKFTIDEEDDRNANIYVWDSAFREVLKKEHVTENQSVVLKAGVTYTIMARISYDIYCDDLNFGVTFSERQFESIAIGEKKTLAPGEYVRFTPDSKVYVYINTYSDVKQLDSTFGNAISPRGSYEILEPGISVYFQNTSYSNEYPVEIILISEVEPIEPYEQKTVTAEKEKKNLSLFYYTPETDMDVEFYSINDDYDFYTLGCISEDTKFSWGNYYSASFSTTASLTAGKTYYFAAYTDFESYSPDTATYNVAFKIAGTIVTGETIKFREDDGSEMEKEVRFTAPDDMLVKFTADPNGWNKETNLTVLDPAGNILSESTVYNGDYRGATAVISAEKGKTYTIRVKYRSDNDYVNGSLTAERICDIKLGDEVKFSGWYRFTPSEDAFAVIKATQTNGIVGYAPAQLYDESFDWIEPNNDFGGGFRGVEAGETYYINISGFKLRPEGQPDGEYDVEFRYGDSEDNEYSKVEFCEPETLAPGETKPMVISSQMFAVYQLSCDEDTAMQIYGQGTGRALACLNDLWANVYKNSTGGTNVMFSLGYTIRGGSKMLVTVMAYEDIDGTITAKLREDFEIVDNVLIAYYGNDPEPQIPENVTGIGKSAFLYNDTLETMIVPEGVTLIDSSAFARCYELTKVNIPGSVEDIGSAAFDFDTKLTDLTLNEGTKTIGAAAFEMCRGITEINLPESITTIGENAFFDCTGLKSVYIPKGVTSIGDMAFGYTYVNGYRPEPVSGFVIRGYKGSEAERYATENGFIFVDVETGEEYYNLLPGDINGDGKVDENDVDFLQDYLNQYDVHICSRNADVNADGFINMKDLVLIRQFLNNWDVELL